jgi:very-short-patch-repair endonuclease
LRKTAYLEERGLIVLRVSWHGLSDDPEGVAARLRAAFEQSTRT